MPYKTKAPAPAPPTPTFKTPMKVPKKKSSTSDLSMVAAFDDLMRNGSIFHDGAEKQFLVFVKNAGEWQKRWQRAEAERQRLNMLLNEREKELSVKDQKIKQAREMVNIEMRERQRVESEKENLQRQWHALQDLVNTAEPVKINNETLEKIRSNYSPAMKKVQRTPSAKRNYLTDNMAPLIEQEQGSLMDASELSFDDSRDDILDGSRLRSGQVYKRRSSNQRQSRSRARRSHSMVGDKIVTTTTVTVDQNGHTHAKAILESQAATFGELQEKLDKKKSRRSQSVPIAPTVKATPATPSVKRTFSNAGTMPGRPHAFQKKTTLREKCSVCEKKIKWGKSCLKCQDCGVVCHPECKLEVPLPCIRGVNRTPTNKHGNFLANFTPLEAPMVPPLLTVCIQEIEKRGLNEVGLYRIPGNESETNDILDKLTHAKGATPLLTKFEIPTITSVVKKFLRSLKEPVIPLSLWQVFVDAATNPDTTDAEAAMYQAVSELPLPNRDTLAYLILHLQTIADNSIFNKMDKDNLAVIMGPTILGYSSSDPMAILSEADVQKAVMKNLLAISSDYWLRFLEPKDQNVFNYLKSNTPETTMFAPLTSVYSPNPTPVGPTGRTGGPAKRTRSRQNVTKQNLFQSPMIF